MRLLLDTNVLLWVLQGDVRLPADWAEIIADPANEIFVSTASIWEAEIKCAAGKLDIPDDLSALIRNFGCVLLDITPADARRAARLPMHHRDPFDRMIISQAIGHGLTMVSSDRLFLAYGVALLGAEV